MRNVPTMIHREIGAYFLSPIAYIVMAIFLLSCGLAFGLGTFRPGGEASLRLLFDPWIILVLVFSWVLHRTRMIGNHTR